MPKIPDYNQPHDSLAKNPPAADIVTTGYGKEWEGVAKLGDAVTDTSIQLMAKRQLADDQDVAAKARYSDYLALQDHKQKIENAADEGLTGYSQSVSQFIQDRNESIQNSPLSERAKQLYAQSTRDLYMHEVASASAKENKARADAMVSGVQADINQSALALENRPDLKQAYDLLDMHRQDIAEKRAASLIDANTASALNENAYHTLSKAYLESLLVKAKGDSRLGNTFAAQGIASLTGKTKLDQLAGENHLFSALSPEEKAHYLKAFTQAQEFNSETNRKELGARLKDQFAALSAGQVGDPSLIPDVQRAINRGDLPADDGARIFHQIALSRAQGSVLTQIASTPLKDRAAKLAEFDGAATTSTQSLQAQFPQVKALQASNFGADAKMRAADQLSAYADSLTKSQMKDPAQAIYDVYPNIRDQMIAAGNDPVKVRQALYALTSKQEAMGLPQRLLPEVTAKGMVQALESGSAEQKTKILGSLQQTYGDHAGKVFDELVDHKLDPKIWAASYVPSPVDRTIILDRISNQKEINDAFRVTQPKEHDRHLLTTTVDQKMQPFMQAMTTNESGSSERPTALKEIVELQAKQLMNEGRAKSTPDAVDQAMRLVAPHFTSIQTANSNLMIPSAGNNEKVIAGFMESHLAPEGLKDLNLALPQGKEDVALSELAKYGRWVNPSGNQLRLQIAKPGLPPLDVRTKDNQFVQYDMRDISKGQIPDTQYQRALTQANKWRVQKMWEKVVP